MLASLLQHSEVLKDVMGDSNIIKFSLLQSEDLFYYNRYFEIMWKEGQWETQKNKQGLNVILEKYYINSMVWGDTD